MKHINEKTIGGFLGGILAGIALILAAPAIGVGVPVTDRTRIWDGTNTVGVGNFTFDGWVDSVKPLMVMNYPVLYNSMGTTDRWYSAQGKGNNTSSLGIAATALYGQYNATLPTNLDANLSVAQQDNRGRLLVNLDAGRGTDVGTPLFITPATGVVVTTSEYYDSSASRTNNTAVSTAAAVPATALTGRRLVRVFNDDAATTVYLCLNDASCDTSGSHKGIALLPGAQRDYPIGPTNTIYAVSAAGTVNVITEELK